MVNSTNFDLDLRGFGIDSDSEELDLIIYLVTLVDVINIRSLK